MYKCAIIGCGNIADKYDKVVPTTWTLTHAGAYHLCDKTELIAAADTDSKALTRFGEKWKIKRLYEDYREMLETEVIDILSLCLPTEKHFDTFKFTCKRNIPAIFCEKPPSYDLKEAKEMVRLSEGRVVSVNYFRRWNPTILQLKEEIQQERYGKVINIIARYTKGIFVNASHLIDLMRWFFGEPEGCHLIKIHNPDTKDPGVDFVLTFKNNIIVYFLHIPDVDYVFIDVDILTEKNRIVLGQRGQRIQRFSFIRAPYYQNFNILEISDDKETDWKNCLIRAVQEIVFCLKYGGQTSCGMLEGLKTLEVCYDILKN